MGGGSCECVGATSHRASEEKPHFFGVIGTKNRENRARPGRPRGRPGLRGAGPARPSLCGDKGQDPSRDGLQGKPRISRKK